MRRIPEENHLWVELCRTPAGQRLRQSYRGKLLANAQSAQVSVSPTHLPLLARPIKPDGDLSPMSHLCLLPKGPVFQEDDSDFPSDSTEDGVFSDTAQESTPGPSGLRVQAKPAPRHAVGSLGTGPCFSVPDSLYLRTLPGFEMTETSEIV